MKITWTEIAWGEYLHWQENDAKILQSINVLIKDVRHDPFRGLGKPEPLNALQGWWSRRITGEHRLVYRVVGSDDDRRIEIAQCRYQYGR